MGFLSAIAFFAKSGWCTYVCGEAAILPYATETGFLQFNR
jgi:hypothetical protein